MGRMQRNKGATFEREVAHALTEMLGGKFERVLGQARDGGGDVQSEFSVLLFECKRRKSLKTLYAWMAQAVASSYSADVVPKLPALAIRADNEETLVVIRMKDLITFAQEIIPDA